MRLRPVAGLFLACILPLAAGCSRGSAASPSGPQPTGSIQTSSIQTSSIQTSSIQTGSIQTGSIQGRVRFSGPLPAPALAEITPVPNCRAPRYDRFFRHEDHMLPPAVPPAFLWISAGLPRQTFHAPRARAALTQAIGAEAVLTRAVLTQIQCRLQPPILGVLPHQPIDFTDSDPFPAHLRVTPRVAGNPALDLTLQPEKPGPVHSFPHPELMIPVTEPKPSRQGHQPRAQGRRSAHAEARAWINVVPTSFFTLSGPQGRFTLRNLPPGTYTLSALQPGYPTQSQTQSQSVTVKANAVTHIHFTFSTSKTPTPSPRHK